MPDLGFGSDLFSAPYQAGPTPRAIPGTRGGEPAGTILGYLSSGRPIVRNEDGSFSTHRNMTITLDGKSYIVPTIYGGKRYSEQDAYDLIIKNKLVDPDTGKPLQAYNSEEEALADEKRLHDILEDEAVSILRNR